MLDFLFREVTSGVTVVEGFFGVLGILYVITQIFFKGTKLGKITETIYKQIGEHNLKAWVMSAADMAEWDNGQKKIWVRNRIIEYANKQGISVPDSAINLIIELAYNKFVKKR